MPTKLPSLILNTASIAGYTLPNMPCSSKAMDLVFKGSTLSFETVESSYSKSLVAALSYPQLDTPAFYVDADGDNPELHRAYVSPGNSGYAFSVFTLNSAVTVLGKYHVGKTKLRDFSDPYLKEVNANENSVWCLSDDNAKYGYQLIFSAPNDFKGDYQKADAEVLGNAILSEARFFVANRRLRKKTILSAIDGIAMVAKAKLMSKASGFLGSSVSKPELTVALNPINELISNRKSLDSVLLSYLYLIENSIHKQNVDDLQELARSIFKNKPDQELQFYLNAITGYTGEFVQDSFVLIQDWKQDVADTVHFITEMLGDRLTAKLPGTETFGDVGIHHPDFLPALEKALAKDGIEYKILDNGSDQNLFMLYETSKKEEFNKHIQNIGSY